MIVLCVDLTYSENLVNRVNNQIENIRALCKEAIDQKELDQINVSFIEKSDLQLRKS
jgi:hypothetical protein